MNSQKLDWTFCQKFLIAVFTFRFTQPTARVEQAFDMAFINNQFATFLHVIWILKLYSILYLLDIYLLFSWYSLDNTATSQGRLGQNEAVAW